MTQETKEYIETWATKISKYKGDKLATLFDKILIFFVCHSGSMKTEFFRNNVTSLVKRFIAQGYEAVIAPYWALDVTIPRYWLPEFLKSLDTGLTISRAMFNANMKVYEKYPTPAAWACLHLYGNPNLKANL